MSASDDHQPDDLLQHFQVTRGHFALESGYHGDLWLDLDHAFGAPHTLRHAIDELARRVAEFDPDVICGPLTGGAFLAFAVAGLLSRRFCWSVRMPYNARKPLYPFGYRIEGDLSHLPGARTVIIDDAINAGSATQATLSDLRGHGAIVHAAAAVLTVGPAAGALCHDEGIALTSLATIDSGLWLPDDCPLCHHGQALIDIT